LTSYIIGGTGRWRVASSQAVIESAIIFSSSAASTRV
jgi:hypothetical protein